MRIPGGAKKIVWQAGQAAVASSLVALMVVAPVLADAQEPMAKASIPSAARTRPLSSQEKTLHALNRLTFGPRPGDEAAASKQGLEAWFQQQLHPETIDDSALNARLAQFPAMQLSSVELMRRFPAPNIIKQAALRGAPLPSDPVLHAVYADEVAMYDLQQKRQAAGLPPIGAPPQAGQVPLAQPDPAMKAAGGDEMMDGGQMMADGKTAAATPDTGKAKGKKNIKNLAEPMPAADVQAILALPADERMQKILAMPPDEFISFRVGLKPFQMPMLLRGLSPSQTEIVMSLQGGTRLVGTEALETRLLRDVYSERQLQAVMTDFWLNHFSVYVRKNQNEAYYLPEYEREVILPNALGKFENLLVATAKSSAMLMYLDNWQSIGPDSPAAKRAEMAKKNNPNGQLAKRAANGLNENYARELMELHTLGVNGGYTQKDVQEVAKVFTGWTIDRPYQAMAGGDGGGGIFDEARHEPGPKTVLGKTIPEGGSAEGMQVLHMLATSPATAKFICTKLAVRFVSDNPPDSLVKKMSDTFLTSGGDIKAVLTTMFHAPEFWAPDVYRAKVKTPIEFMASALRAANADVKNPQPLVQAMDRLGMPIYGMQTPNGYSWKQDEWVSSNALISRMNFALVLSSDRVPGTQTDWTQMLGQGTDVNDPSAATEKHLEALVLGEPASDRTRATVLTQFKDPTTQQKAAEGFASAKPASGEMDASADGSSMDAATARATYRPGRNGGRDFAQLTNKPQTPLDTMAGLLLGSPDFQRR